MNSLSDTLVERGKQYGDFHAKAVFIQNAKELMRATPAWHYMADDQREALEMIQHKISRILYGNHEVVDTWHDIGGYAKLVEDRLNGVDSNAPARTRLETAECPVDNAAAVHTQRLPPCAGYEQDMFMYGDLGLHTSIKQYGGTD